jgi:DNA-binding SARP family transcriptional activator
MEFRILGPLEVSEHGRTLELGATKQQTLLGVLLLHPGEVVSPARLMHELWGEAPPASAAKAVQGYVSGLRRVLGADRIVTRTRGYVLAPARDELDAAVFERLAADAQARLAGDPAAAAELLREALALWRGEPLQGLDFEGLARNEAERLAEQRLAVLERRVEADLAVGRHAELVAELQELVAAHPFRERLRAHLMLALYRSGRQADALSVYRETRSLLADELGLEPGEDLRRLERLMLAQDHELDAPPAPVVAPARPPPDEAAPPSERRRRLVSVVVAEVTGTAALAERLDPESLHALLDRGFAVCAEVMERHGGAVESFSGDSAIGIFGQDRLHEDDALRAVRAAAELRDAAGELGEELERRYGERATVRIGVDAGEVFVAAGTRRPSFATGDPFHVAAGLKAHAAAGEVLLGERAHRLVDPHVQAEPLGGVAIEGRAAEVAAWRLLGFGTRAPLEQRPPGGVFVGRHPEQAQISAALARTERERAARLLAVVGPAGIGKSRLASEAIAGLGPAATVVTSRCLSYGEGIAYRPLAEIVRQLTEGGDLRDLLAGEEGAEQVERGILGAIGRSDEPAHPEETFWAVRRLFESAARERPLVAVIDDIHWAAPALLDLIDYVVAFSSGAPILLVCLGRPEVLERRPGWAAPQRSASVLGLDPLEEVDALTLVTTLGAHGLAARRLVERAEGNPLFLEQLVAIGAEADLPPTIEAVLAARLDQLDPEERTVLEHAAVEGRGFHRGAVAALLGTDELAAPLTALARRQLIHPDRPEHAGEDAFRFAHALIRDVAYRGLPKRRRAELHERMAGWLSAKPDPEDEILGHHLEQACRYRAELGLDADRAVAAEAAQRLASAARSALRRGDASAGAALLERAASLLPAGDPALTELLPALGVALLEAGRLADAERALGQAIDRARAAGDTRAEARAQVERELVRLHADPGSGTEPARRAADAAVRVLDDDLGVCRAWRLRAWIEWTESQSANADAAWRRAAEHARRAGDDRELRDILGWCASAAAFGPMPVAEAIRTCAEIAEEVRASPVAAAVTLRPLALLRAMTGDFAEARRLIAEANATLGELGRLHSSVRHHEAQVEMLAGNPAAAAERLQADLDRLAAMGERALLATTAGMLAQALYEQARHDDADALARVSERSAAAEDLSTQAIWRGVRARLLARRGSHEEAETLAREAVALVAPSDALTDQGDAALALAEILELRGRPDEAAAAARSALELYSRKGAVVMADRARSVLRRSEPQVDGGDHAEIGVR